VKGIVKMFLNSRMRSFSARESPYKYCLSIFCRIELVNLVIRGTSDE
jgi:hypothetical protein